MKHVYDIQSGEVVIVKDYKDFALATVKVKICGKPTILHASFDYISDKIVLKEFYLFEDLDVFYGIKQEVFNCFLEHKKIKGCV